jgi:hypothetical protein
MELSMSTTFDVLIVERPRNWNPTRWTDRPPAPFSVVEDHAAGQTRAEAEGFCFGFNVASREEQGKLWAMMIPVRCTIGDKCRVEIRETPSAAPCEVPLEGVSRHMADAYAETYNAGMIEADAPFRASVVDATLI